MNERANFGDIAAGLQLQIALGMSAKDAEEWARQRLGLPSDEPLDDHNTEHKPN